MVRDPQWHDYAVNYHTALSAERASQNLPLPHPLALPAPLPTWAADDHEEGQAINEMEKTVGDQDGIDLADEDRNDL